MFGENEALIGWLQPCGVAVCKSILSSPPALIMALSNCCRESSVSGLSLGQATTKANSVVKTTTTDRTFIRNLYCTLGAQRTLKSNSENSQLLVVCSSGLNQSLVSQLYIHRTTIIVE